jgi:hypothetical protein
MIIIEGPDASGKSTLADFLAAALSAPIKRSEGPPKSPRDMEDRLKRYMELPPETIFDRHPVVSEHIYSQTFGRTSTIDPGWTRAFYEAAPILIYCDPVRQFPHVVKPGETKEHLESLDTHYPALVDAYRVWAIDHATIIYRGNNRHRILRFLTDFVDDIDQFHHKYGLAYEGRPRRLPEDIRQFRIKFLAEELCEYAGVGDTTRELIQSALIASAPPSIDDQFDALIDLVYVALGTSHLHGFPFAKGWARVQRANMTKVRVLRAGDSARSSVYDVIKDEKFVPPKFHDLLR